MIISHIRDGLGNQLFRYAMGRRLAHKLGTQFKIDTAYYNDFKVRSYKLDEFNITADIATPEEVASLKKLHEGTAMGLEKIPWIFIPEALNWSDNLYLFGAWEDERYFADIAEIIRKEFTLKNPIGAAAQKWREKISAAECAVSLHVRHGDFARNVIAGVIPSSALLPLDYYRECVNRLKKDCPNIKVFVFSNNLLWCRENLRLDVTTEFVSGDGLTDVEELYLMSICRHNIIANSTFSWWGAWLNRNPDKKVFMPVPSFKGMHPTVYRFSLQTIKDSPLDSDRWTRVLFDLGKQPDVTMRPWFSLLMVVNNDAATLPETLATILSQNYKFFELIIIDNASFDGSDNLCRQAEKFSDKVTLIKLYEKISDGAAWNMALNIAQGQYVMFLKGNDRLLANVLSFLYLINERVVADVINSAAWLREDANGNIAIAGRKFVTDSDAPFRNLKNFVWQRFDKLTVLKILSANAKFVPIATKLFNRKFLSDNAIRFDEKISDAELKFITAAMLRADEMLFLPKPFYVAPRR